MNKDNARSIFFCLGDCAFAHIKEYRTHRSHIMVWCRGAGLIILSVGGCLFDVSPHIIDKINICYIHL